MRDIVCELVLMHNLWLVFMLTPPYVVIPCHMFMLLRKDCKRTCGNKFQYVYTTTVSFGTVGVSILPPLPGNIRGHWVAVVRINL